MSFVHGRVTSVLFGGTDVSPYLSDVSVSQERETAETTTFGRPAKTYIAGQRDGSISASGFFDGTADAADETLEGVLGQALPVPASVCPAGQTVGGPAKLAAVKATSYEVESPAADVVTVSAEWQVDGGVDNGRILQPAVEVVASGSSVEVDGGDETAGGAVAHLHVLDVTGTDVVVVIEQSATGVSWVPLHTFTAAAGPSSQRAVVGGTVARYLRATWTLDGASAVFNVSIARRA